MTLTLHRGKLTLKTHRYWLVVRDVKRHPVRLHESDPAVGPPRVIGRLAVRLKRT